MENRIEIWKPVAGYEGAYEISSFGRVRSLERVITYISRTKDGREYTTTHTVNGNILDGCVNKWGYKQVSIGGKIRKIHRLVAEAFIPNPEGKPCIDHINTDKTDNTVWLNEDGSVNYDKTNLRWVTHKENSNNPQTLLKMAEVHKGKTQSKETVEKRVSKLRGKPRPQDVVETIRKTLSKPIIQYNKDGSFIKEYPSIKDAKRETGICSIMDNLRNRQRTAGGYIWKYKEVA